MDDWKQWFLLLARGDKKKAEQYISTGVVPMGDVLEMFMFFQKFIDASAWTTAELEELNNKFSPIDAGRIGGNTKGNESKKHIVGVRRDSLKKYLQENPKPSLEIPMKGKLKRVTLEQFLIHTLGLKLGARTINDDLKALNLLHLKTTLEKR